MQVLPMLLSVLLFLGAGYVAGSLVARRYRERPVRRAAEFLLRAGDCKLAILRALIELSADEATSAPHLLWTCRLLWLIPSVSHGKQRERILAFIRERGLTSCHRGPLGTVYEALRVRELTLWEEHLVGVAATDDQLIAVLLAVYHGGICDSPPLQTGVTRSDCHRLVERLERVMADEEGQVPRVGELKKLIVVLCGMAEII